MLWDIIPLFICRNIIAYLSLGKSDELFDDIIVVRTSVVSRLLVYFGLFVVNTVYFFISL